MYNLIYSAVQLQMDLWFHMHWYKESTERKRKRKLILYYIHFITSPPEGVARYCFHLVCLSVCLSVCLCVRPIFWYFISQLLEEISIWNLYRIRIGLYSIHWKKIDLHRSKVKVTGTVHCFLKVQSYHKNWGIEKYFFHRHLGYSIR